MDSIQLSLEKNRFDSNIWNPPIVNRSEGKLTDQREFLKEAGSNFILKDKILYFSWKEPFNLVAEGDHRFHTPLYFDRRENTPDESIQSQNFSLVETDSQSMAGSPAELNPAELANWLGEEGSNLR